MLETTVVLTVFRLRTDHNRLNHHLYSKLRIGHTEQCPCGTGSQTTEHLLQSCPLYQQPTKGIWPDHTPVARKPYGGQGDLRRIPPSSRRLEFPSNEREEDEVRLSIALLHCHTTLKVT